ncbi:MAG: molecular chaperone DnaJ, partial [Ectopseudomonas oleovorans]
MNDDLDPNLDLTEQVLQLLQ